MLEFFPFQDKRLLSLFSIQSAVTKRQLMIAILAFILQLGVAELAELNGIVACFTSGLAFSHGLKKEELKVCICRSVMGQTSGKAVFPF